MYRVGIDGHMLGDHSGGNETFYSNILKHMEVPDGMEIILFVKPGTDVSEYERKFKIVYFKSRRALVRNFIELTILCKTNMLDVLYVQYFIPFIRPCKVIVTIHDICFEHYKDIFTKIEYLRQKILIPYAAKKADRIITVSEFSKNDIASHYGIDKEKIHVVYNAVSDKFKVLSTEEIDREELLKKYNIPNEEFILSVCNLQPRKNIPRLIKAFVALKEQGINEKLVLVGKKAWMFSEIDELIEKYSGDIFITGYVTEEDLVKFYNICELFVYPSIFEGFGIPPLEAMTCGANVIVSDIPVMNEVVGSEVLKFHPTDINDIERTIKEGIDNGKRRQLDEEQIRKYSWVKSAKMFEQILYI